MAAVGMLEHAVSSDQESDEVWWRAEEFETADRDALDNMRGKDNTCGSPRSGSMVVKIRLPLRAATRTNRFCRKHIVGWLWRE